MGIPRLYSYCNKILFDPQNPQIIYTANSGKGILKTTDDGNTWMYINNGLEVEEEPFYRAITALAMRKQNTQYLYTAQRGGEIYMSCNGGESWMIISDNLDILEPSLMVNDILVSNLQPKNIYVSIGPSGEWVGLPCFDGSLIRTSNDGGTWDPLFPYAAGVIGETLHDPNSLFFSTDFGIVKITDSTLTSVLNNNFNNPDADYLLCNYPNPCNKNTKIIYSLPYNTLIKIKIYNQLGREVKELVNEQKSKGMHTVHWNCKNSQGGDVVSGIYVCSMKCGSIYRSHKMIVMR